MANELNIDNDKNPGELSPLELKASEKGWVPQEEWEGDESDWRPAKEFLDRGELMDRISSQSKQLTQYTSEIKELKDGLKLLAEHNKKIAIKEYEKAVKDLRSRKAEALDMGDHSTVLEIDDQLDELKESKRDIDNTVEKQSSSKTESEGPHPDIVEWMDSNSWYNNDIILQGAADAIAKQYVSKHPDASSNPKQVLAFVESQVKKEFPDRFGGAKRKPSGVTDTDSTGTTQKKGKSKYGVGDLNQFQLQVARKWEKQGLMTIQEYVDQLAEIGELK